MEKTHNQLPRKIYRHQTQPRFQRSGSKCLKNQTKLGSPGFTDIHNLKITKSSHISPIYSQVRSNVENTIQNRRKTEASRKFTSYSQHQNQSQFPVKIQKIVKIQRQKQDFFAYKIDRNQMTKRSDIRNKVNEQEQKNIAINPYSTCRQLFNKKTQPSEIQQSVQSNQSTKFSIKQSLPENMIKNRSILQNLARKTHKYTMGCTKNQNSLKDITNLNVKGYKNFESFFKKVQNTKNIQKDIKTKKKINISLNSQDRQSHNKTVSSIYDKNQGYPKNVLIQIQQLRRKNDELVTQNQQLRQNCKKFAIQIKQKEERQKKIQKKIDENLNSKLKALDRKYKLGEQQKCGIIDQIKMIQSYKQLALQCIVSQLKHKICELSDHINGKKSNQCQNVDNILNNLFKENSELKQQIKTLNLKMWAIDWKNNAGVNSQDKLRKLQLQNRYNKATVKQSTILIQKLRIENDRLRKENNAFQKKKNPFIPSIKNLDSSLSLSFSLC